MAGPSGTKGSQSRHYRMAKHVHGSVHAGLPVVGNVGTRQRLKFTGIGDTEDVASRIEKGCKPALSRFVGRAVPLARGFRTIWQNVSVQGALKCVGCLEASSNGASSLS